MLSLTGCMWIRARGWFSNRGCSLTEGWIRDRGWCLEPEGGLAIEGAGWFRARGCPFTEGCLELEGTPSQRVV